MASVRLGCVVCRVLDSGPASGEADSALARSDEKEAHMVLPLLLLLLLQDLPGALSDAQVAEALGLADIRNRDWAIFKTSAIKGDGLFEGLDWLSNTLKARG
jgi:ADP-ribosylation factor-like protein 1